jgi:hypothetical protein
VAGPGRIAAFYFAPDDVALEHVAAGEGSTAQRARVRPVIGVCDALSNHAPQSKRAKTYVCENGAANASGACKSWCMQGKRTSRQDYSGSSVSSSESFQQPVSRGRAECLQGLASLPQRWADCCCRASWEPEAPAGAGQARRDRRQRQEQDPSVGPLRCSVAPYSTTTRRGTFAAGNCDLHSGRGCFLGLPEAGCGDTVDGAAAGASVVLLSIRQLSDPKLERMG